MLDPCWKAPPLQQKNEPVWKGPGSWGPLHSVILKFGLSFWISYFNPKDRVNYLTGKLFAWVFFAQQDPVTLSSSAQFSAKLKILL